MPKAPRVKGSREAPDLPELVPSDFKQDIWDGVSKGSWSLEEASYYVNEVIPAGKINPKGSDRISQIYAWLSKEYAEGKLYAHLHDEETPLFTPGTIMRFLWESEKYVSLKVWALHTAAENGTLDFLVTKSVSKNSYEIAAKVIWTKYPEATQAEVIKLLQELRDLVKKPNGHPVFRVAEYDVLKKMLQKIKKGEKGRRASEEAVELSDKKDILIPLIRKELGI